MCRTRATRTRPTDHQVTREARPCCSRIGGGEATPCGHHRAGIYGVLSYTVSQRVPEIGVRMALGARRGEIVRMMIATGARLGLIGIAAGVAVSLATSRILNGLLIGVEGTDAVTYASVIVLMFVAALLACAIPAMRAARVNPLSAIRAE